MRLNGITYLLLASAVCLSAVAAYYSIAGLVAIFAAAAVPIIVMGATLELSKLVVCSWLYRNWNTTPRLLKSYFVLAVATLMILTSMGIFGFLSKAHVDQNLVSGDVVARLSLIDERIKIERENIDANRKIITQLDSAVDQTIARTTDAVGADRASGLRRSQAKERKAAQEAILSSQAKIDQLNTDKAPIAAQVREVEAEVGPVKYIAALIYGDNPDAGLLEKAVRIVILMIVFVFDPLAVLMFMAANQDMARMYHKRTIEPLDESSVIQTEPYEEMNERDWTEYFSQPVEEITIEVPDRQPIVEQSSKPNGGLYHVTIEDHVTAESDGEIKHDQGMRGLFSRPIG